MGGVAVARSVTGTYGAMSVTAESVFFTSCDFIAADRSEGARLFRI